MPIAPGTRIDSYEIVSAVGAGGMGEVFRARDTKLNRDVAIKVLPDSVATDPERLTRFEREAQTLAALNHPHIAQIYGVLELDARAGQPHRVFALVMEFVAGDDLAERLTRGPVPIDEAVGMATQIAEALEAAHDRGIIHRDLKPANVKVTPDGIVKVLDFGLAKAVGSEPDTTDTANSPTYTSQPNLTRHGTLLGTAAYLAPEQVRGKPVDRRVDIWAVGCVLYELLVGHQPFNGESLADTLGSIVKDPPRWDDLPVDTPPAIRRLLMRCLAKDPSRRLRDIGEARIVLQDELSGTPETPPTAMRGLPARPRMLRRLALLSIATALPLALLAGIKLGSPRAADPAMPIIRYEEVPPSGTLLRLDIRPAVALSRDGAMVAYVATRDGIPRLFVRARDSVDTRTLPGTEGATSPSFSPDGRWIAFFADGKVKKVALDGPPIPLASAPDVRGIAWQDDHTLIFPRGPTDPLVAMSADGGEASRFRNSRRPSARTAGPTFCQAARPSSSPSARRPVRTTMTTPRSKR